MSTLAADLAFDPTEWRNWDKESQRKVANALEAATKGAGLVWYCSRGRACNGRPHDGVPYKHARSDQWPPPGIDWFVWLVISGRGAGKTRTGAEWVRAMSKRVSASAMIGRRGTDVRATMVEGISGLIPVCQRAGIGYQWEPSKKEFTFDNGHKVFGYSAEEPDSLRGPQHGAAWLDEPAHMALIGEVWDNLLMGLRNDDGIPGGSKVLCTSTPLPIKWLKDRMKEDDTVTVQVPTSVNADNLDPQFRKHVIARYEGTRKGRQELYGEILEDLEGALWGISVIDDNRAPLPDDFERVVVGVDPAGTSTTRSDETGIVVVGRIGNEYWVIDDLSGKYSPAEWAKKVAAAYRKWSADRIVAEKNYGGEMVTATLRNVSENLPITEVVSRRGKMIRAEPVAALYEQHRVHHLQSEALKDLEDQMTQWIPGQGDSPDRVDALVHALTDQAKVSGAAEVASPTGRISGASHHPAARDARMARGIRSLMRG